MINSDRSNLCIGMIVPPAAGAVPPEPLELFPDVRFIATGLGLTKLTPEGYDQVIAQIADCARELAERGADVVSLMGTSLSFYRGPEFNTELVVTMTNASGKPATTMTNSVIDALKHLGCTTLTVATAYGEDVNEPLRDYLLKHGFAIQNFNSMDIESVEEIFEVNDDDLMKLGEQAISDAPDAEALFISCGGLNTASITEPLEQSFDIPVISSAMAGTWGAMRLAGLDHRRAGYGRLFAS